MFSETELAVFVLDKRNKPLVPGSQKRARLRLTRGRAVVHRYDPFTIRLNNRIGGEVRPLLVKIDPGSKTTGVAVASDVNTPAQAKNLIAACIPCNTEKDARPIEAFLAGKPAVIARIKAQARAPLKDAVAGRYGFAVPASPVAAFGRTAFHPRLPATLASGGF
jgi:RRXRR protein